MTFGRRFAGICEGEGTVAVGVSFEACYGVSFLAFFLIMSSLNF